MSVNYSFALQESSRNLSSFKINNAIVVQTQFSLDNMTSIPLSAIKIPEYISKEKLIDNSSRTNSKFKSAKECFKYRPLITINYIGLLKLYNLEKEIKSSNLLEKVNRFKNFVDQDLDMTNAELELYSLIYFNDEENKGVIKRSKKPSNMLYNIWNAAIDLTAFYETVLSFRENPIFVTADKRLAKLFSRLKVKLINKVSENDTPSHIITEVNYEGLKIKDEDLDRVIEHTNEIGFKRREKLKKRIIEKSQGKSKDYDMDHLFNLLKANEKTIIDSLK